MVNTTHQTGWFKTNKTITVIISIMLAVCPIPLRKEGCVSPQPQAVTPLECTPMVSPPWGTGAFSVGSRGLCDAKVGLSILLKRKSYWTLQSRKEIWRQQVLLGWPESQFWFFHKMLHVLCMCLHSLDTSSLQNWYLVTFSISSSERLLTGRSSELQ